MFQELKIKMVLLGDKKFKDKAFKISNVIFFYNSPIGTLEIHLKKDQIYSLSRVSLKTKVPSECPLFVYPDDMLFLGNIKSFSSFTYFKSDFLMGPNLKISELIYKLLLFLEAYFSKRETYNPPFSLFSRGTSFQKRVWTHLRKIPYGCTRSYGEVANMIGFPGAARAVGSACAKNPWLILVPCHRVVAQKSLGGFALGLSKKKWLLDHENN